MTPGFRNRTAGLTACFAFVVVTLAAKSPAWAQAGADAVDPGDAVMATDLPVSASDSAATDDDALPFRLSLPTEDDRSAWKGSGFRMQLGLAYGQIEGLFGAPSGSLTAAILRVGARLDVDWSILGSFQYGAVSEVGGLNGLRFAVTLDPSWHATERIELAVGVGFGGLFEGRTGRAEPDAALRKSLVDSYTLPNARTPIPTCRGIGATSLARASWTLVMSPLASVGLAVELDGQWTGCVDSVGQVEPDTAQPIVRRQWWPHVGGKVVWLVGWR